MTPLSLTRRLIIRPPTAFKRASSAASAACWPWPMYWVLRYLPKTATSITFHIRI